MRAPLHSHGALPRRLVVGGLSILLMLGLVACGGDDEEGADADSDGPERSAGWTHPNKDVRNTRDASGSDADIDASNVAELGVAWTFEIPARAQFGAAATNPLIAGGVAYLQDLESNVYAIDLESGDEIWSTEYDNETVGPNGVAIGTHNVFALSSPNDLVALDRDTGEESWSKSFDNKANIQPVAFGDRVYFGTTAGGNEAYEGGKSGIAYALDQDTGQVEWEFTVVEEGFWGNPELNSGGGLWYPPAVDDQRGLIYWGTGNPGPFPGTEQYPNGTSRPGPNLHSSSLIALDMATGEFRWGYQARPHDIFDLDLQLSPILADVAGVGDRIIASGKVGVVYGIDPQSHKVVWERSVGVHQNDTLEAIPEGEELEVLPGTLGGVETPMAYADDVVYVPVLNLPTVHTATSWGAKDGTEALQNATAHTASPADGTSEMTAIDARDGEILWVRRFDASNFGAATVVNDLVFTSTFDGIVYALDRRDGGIVWTYEAPGGINGSPAVAGDMILVPAGLGDDASLVALRLGADRTSEQPSQASTTTSQEAREETIEISAEDNAFDTETIRVRAGQHVTIRFTNDDSAPHNIAVYRSAEAEDEIFVGEVISGPDETVTYEFDAPTEPGTYFFRCDIHPIQMTGDFIVE